MLSQDDIAPLQEAIIRELTYFCTHLPFKDKDDVTVVLKGQLLVEEQLVAYVKGRLARPEKIQRFMFDRYLCLAEALTPDSHYNWIFEACRKLNGIRNHMSHQLSPADIDKLIKEFTAYVKKHAGVMLDSTSFKCNLADFRTAVLALYASLRNFDRPIGRSIRIKTLLEGAKGA